MRHRYVSTFVAFCLVIGITGCSNLTTEAKSLLAASASQARERATAFILVKDKIKAKDAKDAELVTRWSSAHSSGLNASAAGLNSMLRASETGTPLTDLSLEALREEAATTAARVDNLDRIMPYLSLDGDTATFMAAHREALNTETVAMSKLAALVAKKQDKPATPTSIPVVK